MCTSLYSFIPLWSTYQVLLREDRTRMLGNSQDPTFMASVPTLMEKQGQSPRLPFLSVLLNISKRISYRLSAVDPEDQGAGL